MSTLNSSLNVTVKEGEGVLITLFVDEGLEGLGRQWLNYLL